jgi:hypothetical protein
MRQNNSKNWREILNQIILVFSAHSTPKCMDLGVVWAEKTIGRFTFAVPGTFSVK